MSQQLVKKGANGKHVNVMPKSWIEAIKDKNTGQTLVEILQGFNMYFLPYNGNTTSTRCLVPTMLRKKGLWITYVKYDGNVYTEWYAADEIDDKSWGDSSNWRVGNNTLVGDITISANGNWVINGTETEFKAVGEKGNTPLIRVANNRLQVSYDLGDTYTDVTNNPVYTKFRWLATTGDTQANNVGRIQASTDEGKTWTNMSNDFINNLHISRYIGISESLPTSGIAEGTIYAKGPTYADGDTSHANPIYRLWVYAWKGDTLAWQDNGEFTSIAAGVVQETGNSETEVMSQKAVSEKLFELESETSLIDATKVVPSENKGYFISQSSLQPTKTSALICYTSPIFVPKYAKIVANIQGTNLMSVMALSDENGNIIRSLYAGNGMQTKYDFSPTEDCYVVLSYVYSEPYSIVIGKNEVDIKNDIKKLQSISANSKLTSITDNVEVNQYLKEITIIDFDYTLPCKITFQKAHEYNGKYYNGANVLQSGNTTSIVNIYNNAEDAINNGNIFLVERNGNVAIFDLSTLAEGDVIEYNNVLITGNTLYNNAINLYFKSPAKAYNILNMGDSLFGAYRDHTSISNHLTQMTSAKVLNGAMGGTTMAVWYEDYSETNKQGWSDFSFYRLAASIASKNFSKQRSSLELYKVYLPSYFNDVIDILESIDYNEIDIITLSFGTNDYTCNVPLVSTEDWQEQYRFIPALKKGMELIYNAYPHIRFVLCTPMYRGDRTNENEAGLYLSDYVNAIRDTAKEYNTLVCDFNGEMGVNSYNIKSIFGNQTDLVHPTAEGRKMMANKLASCINQM